MDFRMVVRLLRLRTGEKQEEMGIRLGYVSGAYLSHIERGAQKPTKDIAERILLAYAAELTKQEAAVLRRVK